MDAKKQKPIFLFIAGINVIASLVLLFFSAWILFDLIVNKKPLVELWIFLSVFLLGAGVGVAGMHTYQLKPKSYYGNVLACWVIGATGILLIGMVGFTFGQHSCWACLGPLGAVCLLMAFIERILLLNREVKNRLR